MKALKREIFHSLSRDKRRQSRNNPKLCTKDKIHTVSRVKKRRVRDKTSLDTLKRPQSEAVF